MVLNPSAPLANNVHRRAIGTFPNRSAAEHALHELRDSGFPMDRVSVVAQDSKSNDTLAGAEVDNRVANRDRVTNPDRVANPERAANPDRDDNKADDGAKVGALSGGALGGLTGLLVGIGALAIPGIGPIMLAGAAATALATTVAGSAIGAAAGSLLGGLVGMGIPEERARVYNDRVSAGEYLVMVDGTDAEIGRAEAILNHRGIQNWGVYDIPTAKSAPVAQSSAAVAPPVVTPPVIAPSVVAPPVESTRSVAPVSAPIPTPVEPLAAQPVSASDDEAIRLYEERLVVSKDREKTGEVSLGKRIEEERAVASVPIEKERVVIERVPINEATATDLGADAFREGEAVRMEVYEETPDIRKEAFVSEEVTLRKEVVEETVDAEETVRRERLDLDTKGRPIVDDRQ